MVATATHRIIKLLFVPCILNGEYIEWISQNIFNYVADLFSNFEFEYPELTRSNLGL